MAEFKSNPLIFRRQTFRRLLWEFLLLGILVAAISLELLRAVPIWIQWVAVASFGTYVLVGLTLYPRAKAVAESLCVRLHDDGLVFNYVGGGGELRYADIRVRTVKRRRGEIIEIALVAKSGQVIRFRGLENMSELHHLLSRRIAG
jgi:hypothetical protein